MRSSLGRVWRVPPQCVVRRARVTFVSVRRAVMADLDVLVRTLVDSHLDYVWERWAIQGPDRRVRLTTLVRQHVELIAIPSREIWMHDDGAGVAIWRAEPAGPTPSDVLERVADVGRSVFGDRLELIEAVDAEVLAHRPTEPHRFLGTIGIRPDRQRRGLGTALLRPVLDELDRTEVPACLETSAAGNLVFYGSLGFTVVAHLDQLPGDAPETWVMWRPPAV